MISIHPLNLLLSLSSPLYLLTIGLLIRGHDLLRWPTTLPPKHREVTSLRGPTVDGLCTLWEFTLSQGDTLFLFNFVCTFSFLFFTMQLNLGRTA